MSRRSMEAEAAGWLGRRDRGFSQAEAEAFVAWLAGDARRRTAVERVERTWNALDRLQAIEPSGAVDPNALARKPGRLPPGVRVMVGAVAASTLLALLLWHRTAAPAPARPFSTGADGFQRVTLDDGSQVELNGSTRIDVQFTAGQRLVRLLNGEANFEVARDPARPFVVSAESVGVRAVGTAFDVRLWQGSVTVLVTEGRVRVDAGTPSSQFVDAGQRLVVTAGRSGPPAVAEVARADADQALAWDRSVLDLNESALPDVVAEFNRRNPGRLVVADPELAAMRISGSVRLDNEDAFVRLLESAYGVTADRSDSGETVLRKAR